MEDVMGLIDEIYEKRFCECYDGIEELIDEALEIEPNNTVLLRLKIEELEAERDMFVDMYEEAEAKNKALTK